MTPGVEFGRVRSAWQQLGGNSRYFFQTPEWMDLLAERLEGDVAWGVMVVDGRPTAVSVLRRSVRAAGGVNLKILSQVRAGDAQQLYADGLLDRSVFGPRKLHDLVDLSGPWHVLWLVGLRAGSPWLELPGAALVRAEPNGGVGILDTTAAFDECWGAVPKNMRDSVRKARRRIAASGRAEIVVATGPDIVAAYEAFVELEASGWKAHRGGALADLPDDRRLLGEYLRVAGTAQIRSLRLNDRLVAAQLAVTSARTMFLPRIAYDEELGHLSPSNVLMADLIKVCCDDPGIDRLDCLVWQPWHPRWGMVREPTYSLVAFNNRTVRGLLARAARRAWEVFNRRSVRGSAARSARGGTLSTNRAITVQRTQMPPSEVASLSGGAWRLIVRPC